MSAAVYAEVVAATIARLRAAEARPPIVIEAIAPDASKIAHYCTHCDLSWRGPAPCWSCDNPGVTHNEIDDNDRKLWAFSTAMTGTFTEGETP